MKSDEKGGTIKVGCCGFTVSRGKYYKNFEIVEVQKTFYRFPDMKNIIKWREEAPEKFEFTLKASQLITHLPSSPTYRKFEMAIPEKEKELYGFFKPTEKVFEAWEKTKEIARTLKANKILFQMPPGFQPTSENKNNMKKFFSKIKREEFILIWEPRGKWEEKEIKAMCAELGLIHCVDPFKSEPLYGHFAYFRLHGTGDYKYRYTEDDLIKLKENCIEKKETYCFFNNINMFEDALKFKKLLE
jgi:uncharacterized protein YecE (DUF72 family)